MEKSSPTPKQNPSDLESAASKEKISKTAAGKSGATKTRSTKRSKPAKAAAKGRAAKSVPRRPETPFSLSATPSPCVSTGDIALRAYYLGEKRQKLGVPGDSAQDWIEAERQLVVEAKAQPKD